MAQQPFGTGMQSQSMGSAGKGGAELKDILSKYLQSGDLSMQSLGDSAMGSLTAKVGGEKGVQAIGNGLSAAGSAIGGGASAVGSGVASGASAAGSAISHL